MPLSELEVKYPGASSGCQTNYGTSSAVSEPMSTAFSSSEGGKVPLTTEHLPFFNP